MATTTIMRRLPAPSASRSGRRYLLYSHDGLGLGHVQRNIAIASALVAQDPEAAVILATGALEVGTLSLPPRTDVLVLPGLRKLGRGSYGPRRLPQSTAEVIGVRRELLTAAAEAFLPDVLLVDRHPLGVGGELIPALRLVRSRGGRAALGLREVLDEPSKIAEEWLTLDMPSAIVRHHDLVLVYGRSEVFDTLRNYRFPPIVAAMTIECGYVVREAAIEPSPDAPGGPPVVIASAGGGEDGLTLLETFLLAAEGSGWRSSVVAGPHSPKPDRDRLHRLASKAGVAFHQSVPGLASINRSADAVVCMGGYNTLVEAIAAGTPVVCAPRSAPRSEQLIRARAFADRDLLRLVEPDLLSPGTLRSAVESALAEGASSPRKRRQERAASVLELRGASRAAAALSELAGRAADVRLAEAAR